MFFALTSFLSCSQKLEGATGVSNFDVSKYLGKWYEVARLDTWFEKDMDNTEAFYSLNEDGTVRVENSGYNFVKKKWKTSIGKAKFRGDKNVGDLKVSFFGPFYGDYTIIALDSEYKYSLVVGNTNEYLWIFEPDNSEEYIADSEVPVFKNLDDLSQIIEEKDVDILGIAQSSELITTITDEVELYKMPDFYEMATGKFYIDEKTITELYYQFAKSKLYHLLLL